MRFPTSPISAKILTEDRFQFLPSITDKHGVHVIQIPDKNRKPTFRSATCQRGSQAAFQDPCIDLVTRLFSRLRDLAA